MTVIDPPQSINTFFAFASDKGVIAGSYVDAGHASHGFVRTPQGKFKTFDAPNGDPDIAVTGINNAGDVTGYFGDNGSVDGFIRTADGTFTLFQPPGLGAVPVSINAKGETTGDYSGNGKSVGFFRKPNGKITSFRVPNSNGDTVPTGVNSAGVVAGFAYVKRAKHTSEIIGFIRTP